MSPACFSRTDVTLNIRRRAPLGPRDQDADSVEEQARRHAALVHREGYRDPALQRRHLAE